MDFVTELPPSKGKSNTDHRRTFLQVNAFCAPPEAPLGARDGKAHGSNLRPVPAVHILGMAELLRSSRGHSESLFRISPAVQWPDGEGELEPRECAPVRGGLAQHHLELLPGVGGPQTPWFLRLLVSPPSWRPVTTNCHSLSTRSRRQQPSWFEQTSVAAGESGIRCMLLSPAPLCSRSVGRAATGPWPPRTRTEGLAG